MHLEGQKVLVFYIPYEILKVQDCWKNVGPSPPYHMPLWLTWAQNRVQERGKRDNPKGLITLVRVVEVKEMGAYQLWGIEWHVAICKQIQTNARPNWEAMWDVRREAPRAKIRQSRVKHVIWLWIDGMGRYYLGLENKVCTYMFLFLCHKGQTRQPLYRLSSLSLSLSL